MKAKSDVGHCLQMFVRSARNMLVYDAKVCYLRTDQGTEYTGGYTVKVLLQLSAELQVTCPDTPQHNGVSECFNQTIQMKVRFYMYDAKLPESMWDLALLAAVYAYNRTPHKSNNIVIPLEKFAPDHSFNIKQIKRFGCIAYIKVHQKTGPKFRVEGRRVVSVGYTPTGFQFFRPEDGKFYKSREVRFNEKLVYGDKFTKQDIKDFPQVTEVINKERWFLELKEDEKETERDSKPEGEIKRKRGRPRKESTVKLIEDSSFSDLQIDERLNGNVFLTDFPDEKETVSDQINDETHYALLAKINCDPVNYKEAMQSKDKDLWQMAIKDELNSMKRNKVWIEVKRTTKMSN